LKKDNYLDQGFEASMDKRAAFPLQMIFAIPVQRTPSTWPGDSNPVVKISQ
jgi:hypothetical protein